MKVRTFFAVSLILFSVLSVPLLVDAQTTEFAYQGSLNDGGIAANGNYDFEFLLFDALAGGSQVGMTIPKSMAVAAGTFSVKLDYGAVFPGANRYLEIRVRLMGVPGFTILEPRQLINSTPYAVKSLNSTTAATATNATQLGGVAAIQFVVTTDPRMTDARNPLPNSPNYIRNSTTQQTLANINISGTANFGSHGNFDGTLSAGNFFVVGNSTLQGNLTVNGTGTAPTFNATTQFNVGGSRFLSKPGTENTFAGIGTGMVNTGASNSFFGFNAGNLNTTGANNAFFGSEAGTSNTQGQVNTFLGSAAGKDNTLGSENTFVGTAAGFINTEGSQNTFVGRSAGRLNIDASNNTLVGYQAGLNTGANNGADANSIFGSEAGKANMTGAFNSFFGFRSGFNTNGGGNSFFGSQAGESNTFGIGNSFFGNGSGSGNTNGIFNLFLGTAAGNSNTTGDNNTIIGNAADVGSGDLSYATAIGSDAVVTTSNTVVLGRSADIVRIPGFLRIVQLGSAGATTLCQNGNDTIATCSSSLRYKTNINGFSSGVELVRRLKPITFDWKDGGMHDLGLGAEDVAAIEPLLVTYNKDGQVEGVKYDRIGVVLVNAVKEQQRTIERQQSQIDALVKLVCAGNKTADLCNEK